MTQNGTIPDFFYTFLMRHKLSPLPTPTWPGRNFVQVTCNTPGAYHVLHIVRRVARRESSPIIKFDRVEIAFSLSLFHWPKPSTDERCLNLGFQCVITGVRVSVNQCTHLQTVYAEIKRMGYTWGQLERLSQDRNAWRALVGGLCSSSVSVSAQDDIVALGKAHTRSAPSLSSLPKVASKQCQYLPG